MGSNKGVFLITELQGSALFLLLRRNHIKRNNRDLQVGPQLIALARWHIQDRKQVPRGRRVAGVERDDVSAILVSCMPSCPGLDGLGSHISPAPAITLPTWPGAPTFLQRDGWGNLKQIDVLRPESGGPPRLLCCAPPQAQSLLQDPFINKMHVQHAKEMSWVSVKVFPSLQLTGFLLPLQVLVLSFGRGSVPSTSTLLSALCDRRSHLDPWILQLGPYYKTWICQSP